MAKFKFHVSTRHVGSTVSDDFEIPDGDLEGLDPESMEYADVVEEYATDLLWNNIDWGWERA